MNRFDRIVAILLHLQTRRVVSGPTLATRFGVSVRTIYRDLRTLALAGVPLLGEPKLGYSLAEGYRLPPVMFTREEAAALLMAEQLATRLTDAPTAQLSRAAMDKVRAVLRRADRDYLQVLTPRLHMLEPADPPPTANGYQLLLLAVATHQVVHLRYQATATDPLTDRAVEPLGLYFAQHWHVVAYCRLREAFRNFCLDRIQHLVLRPEVVLLLNGTKSPAYLRQACVALAQVLPKAQRLELTGLSHSGPWNADLGGKPATVAAAIRAFLLA